MSRNIEIKAKLPNRAAVEAQLAAMADEGPILLEQEDTFFHCAKGRLKLRVFADQSAELIYYQRADQSGPKESFYIRTPIPDPISFFEALSHANGVSGRVVKKRTVYMIGRTRVHLDFVENLGNFLELEVVLKDSEANDVGVKEAKAILAMLKIDETQLEEPAYIDLLQRKSN